MVSSRRYCLRIEILRDRLTAGRGTLNPLIMVRIHVPEPQNTSASALVFCGSPAERSESGQPAGVSTTAGCGHGSRRSEASHPAVLLACESESLYMRKPCTNGSGTSERTLVSWPSSLQYTRMCARLRLRFLRNPPSGNSAAVHAFFCS